MAAFHSLVGLATVMVAAAAIYAPESFGIGTAGHIHGQALVEMALGVAIGAITFTGSVIAFLKLDGRMSGKLIMLPARHLINIVLGLALVVLIVLLVTTESKAVFWLIVIASLVLGVLFLAKPEVGLGALDALPVGLLVLVIGLSLGGTTGYAINPARDFGPRLAHALLPIAGKGPSDWAYAWVPVLGPLLGGGLAGWVLFALGA